MANLDNAVVWNAQFSARFVKLLVPMAVVLLSACGGSSGGSQPEQGFANAGNINIPADTVSRVGHIVFAYSDGSDSDEDSRTGGLAGGEASFTDYGGVMSQSFIEEQYSFVPENTCRIYLNHPDGSVEQSHKDNENHKEFEAQSKLISAGEVLTIATPTGSWPELKLGVFFDDYYDFEGDVISLGDLPSGSTINIPGAEFPVFTDVPIPAVDRITSRSFTDVVDNALTPSSAIVWSKPTSPSSGNFVYIALNSNEEQSVTDEVGYAFASCRVEDNGEFRFPSNVKQLMSKYQFPIDNIGFIRVSRTVKVEGNAAVHVSNMYFY